LNTVYFVCALAGGALLVLQFLLGLLGLEHHDFDIDSGHLHAADTLNLLSVRTLAAGLAFFGLLGMLTRAWGGGAALALVVASAGSVSCSPRASSATSPARSSRASSSSCCSRWSSTGR